MWREQELDEVKAAGEEILHGKGSAGPAVLGVFVGLIATCCLCKYGRRWVRFRRMMRYSRELEQEGVEMVYDD